nr:hypothetical protein [Tanacetum cinerariifolium]
MREQGYASWVLGKSTWGCWGEGEERI